MNSSCPLPSGQYPKITMAHGSGGRIMHRLIQETFAESLGLDLVKDLNDAAVLALKSASGKLAFTTDSYVVRPLFFPGGISVPWLFSALSTIWP